MADDNDIPDSAFAFKRPVSPSAINSVANISSPADRAEQWRESATALSKVPALREGVNALEQATTQNLNREQLGE